MKALRSAFLVVLVTALLTGLTIAQTDQDIPESGPGYELLDRDAKGTPWRTPYDKGPPSPSPMATLQHPGATTGVTMVSIGFFPTMAPASFIGNFFTAPGDFPTSYYPFFVTGAFAWGTGPPTMATLGAGVANGPFPVGTMMWNGFATASLPGPPAMTSGLFGAPGIFPSTPPTVAVPTGAGVACGLFSVPGPGPGVGALAFPPTPRPFRVSFSGPPMGTQDFLATATFVLPNAVVAGCYISGATVPVELQHFSVE
ncbi:MAG: hypothetical protein QNJ40_10865 [Xanthomonadales bacterium]|nr:hypothetical protein [Xanthomonadales bacterium]